MTALLTLFVAGLAVTAVAAEPAAVAELARDAEAVVLGRVERTVRHDVVGVRVHRVRTLRVLSGRLRDPDPDVLELRDGSSGDATLEAGRRVVVFLRSGPPLSHFDDDLPRLPCFITVGGAKGVIPVGSDEEVEAVEAALRRAAAPGGPLSSTFVPVSGVSPR